MIGPFRIPFAFLLVLSLLSLNSLIAQNTSLLEFDRTRLDLGRVLEGQIKKFTFTYKNPKSASITIRKVETSCGCTAAVPKPHILAPGATGTLSIEFDSTGRSGKWTGYIKIFDQDPPNGLSIIHLQAEVVPEVKLSRSYIYFGEVYRGQTPIQPIVLENIAFKGFKIEKVECTDKAYETRISEPNGDQPGGRFTLEVSLRSDAPYGFIEGHIHIHTNYSRDPIFRIFLITRVKGRVELDMTKIDMGIMERTPEFIGREKVLGIRSNDESITIHSVRTDLEGIELETRTLKAGHQFEIIVRLVAPEKLPSETSRIRGTLIILTSSQERPEISVPIRMILRK